MDQVGIALWGQLHIFTFYFAEYCLRKWMIYDFQNVCFSFMTSQQFFKHRGDSINSGGLQHCYVIPLWENNFKHSRTTKNNSEEEKRIAALFFHRLSPALRHTYIYSPLVCAHPRKLSPDCPVFSSQFCLFSYRLCTDRTPSQSN